MKKILLYVYYIFAVMVFNSCLAAHPPRERALARPPTTQNPPRARSLVECLKYKPATCQPATQRDTQTKTMLPMPPGLLSRFEEIILKYANLDWFVYEKAQKEELQLAGFSDSNLGNLQLWIYHPLQAATEAYDLQTLWAILRWKQIKEDWVDEAEKAAARCNNIDVIVELGKFRDLSPRRDLLVLYAIQHDSIEVLGYLLSREAQLTLKMQEERLWTAVYHESYSALELLLARRYNCKTSANLLALAVSQKNEEMFELLLKYGTAIDPAPLAEGEMKMPYYTALIESIRNDDHIITTILLERGADPNRAGVNGLAPLHVATYENQVEIIEILLRYGAEIDDTATNASRETPLHVATCKHNFNVVKRLLDRGTDPNRAAIDGETPLHVATYEHQVDIVEILLEKGADPNAPLTAIVDRRSKPIYGYRLSDDEDPNFYPAGGCPLHIAAKAGDAQTVQLLVSRGEQRT